MAPQRILKGLQSKRNSLRVIQAVDTEYQLATRQQAMQILGFLRDLDRCSLSQERIEVDADRKIADPNRPIADPRDDHLAPPIEFDLFDQVAHALDKVASIACGLKTDQVELE